MPGEFVTVISPQGAMTAVGLVPKMRRFEVAGLVEVGMYEYDSSLAYTSLAAAQEFAGLGDRVTGIEVKLDDPWQARVVSQRLTGLLAGPYWVRDWMDMNKNLFAALQLEKLALFIIVTIIVLVAAFAIVGHLVLLVAEKRKEIGILKAMGASAGSIGGDLPRGRHADLRGGDGRGQRPRACLLIWVQNTYRIIRLAGRRLPDQLPADEAHRDRLRPGRRRHPRDLLPRDAVARPARRPGSTRSRSCAMSEPLLVATDLEREYRIGPEPVRVLKGASLTVNAGETVAVIGASGVGKSTLLHILGTLDRPTSGRVLFAGEDVFARSEAGLARLRRSEVGFVFQFYNLLGEMTALENAMLPALIQRRPGR